MTSLELGLFKGPCSILESASTRGYSVLLLGFVGIPVGSAYHDSNGKGVLLQVLRYYHCIKLAVFIYVFRGVYLLWTGLCLTV